MPGRSSIEAIHLIRSLMEKYKERQRDQHLALLYLEKPYDSVPRELIWKTLIDTGASRRYIKVIRDMYDGAKSRRNDEDVSHRIKAAWLKWKVDTLKALANSMEVTELRMLSWTCGKTMLDMIPNGVYRAELEVETI
ncbi:hypothetical protein Tco_0218844 [Tanacetum coccineum]